MTSALHSISNDKKRVHFGGALDWEEERRRSCRGVEARQRRKEQKMSLQRQQQALRKAVLQILRDSKYENGIVKICSTGTLGFDIATRAIMLEIIGDGGNGDQEGACDDNRLRLLLQQFRSSEKKTIEQLSDSELFGIDYLKGYPPLNEEFHASLPVTVVTSSSESSSTETTPTGTEFAAKRKRRNEKQGKENATKRFPRGMGGPIVFQSARAHVPPEEDEQVDEPN